MVLIDWISGVETADQAARVHFARSIVEGAIVGCVVAETDGRPGDRPARWRPYAFPGHAMASPQLHAELPNAKREFEVAYARSYAEHIATNGSAAEH